MISAPTNLAIAHRRVEPLDSLDYFPTGPWATRALFEHVLGRRGFRDQVVEEPACGEGHMAYPLQDYFGEVRATDIFPYGWGEVRDFLDPAAWAEIAPPDWVITNPPFGDAAIHFVKRALMRATKGVAMLVRTTQLEGVNRYREIYRHRPPAIVAPYVERLPIHKGRWIPDGDTMTAYCWLIWSLPLARPARDPAVRWIPPSRDRLHFQRDLETLPWISKADARAEDLAREAAAAIEVDA